MAEAGPGLLAIRADAGPGIGAGHVMRCLALAQAWKRAGGRAVLVGRVDPPALAARLAREGLPVVAPPPGDADGAAAFSQARGEAAGEPGAHWGVLDGYAFGPDVQAAARRDGPLLVLDDLAAGRVHADAVLNQNFHAPSLRYDADPGAALLLGPAYALLREDFLRRPRPARHFPGRARTVLVTMGGADPDNATAALLAALSAVGDPALDVAVVAGPANRHAVTLARALADAPFPGRLLRDPPDLSGLMAAADLVVTAGGSTCLELCFCGAPMAVAVLAANQAPGTAALTGAGAAVSLGPAGALDVAATAAILDGLLGDAGQRRRLSETAARLVDGRGGDRLAAALCERAGTRLRLLPARAADAETLLAWRNDPQTVAVSHTDRPVAPDEHRRWLAASLKNPDRRLYLAEEGGVPAGTVRLDRDGDGWLLSWTVAPGFRGRGLGKAMVRLAADALSGPVRAEVKAGNAASARIAACAGLRLDHERDGVRYYVRPSKEDATP
ncbi:UDP-2,4-diacetamido-2,4,6-trideoxy-beta-L-altropyranose hydrolase [Solidesulfovibrio sp.]|uniref:UDP-2,4-diacetamido-2,4, 6-trideoxy-beta-L-altropyranose hydrolase n=1 Tax=Solidesulfovibrio sp. TaxID=2910990 RepID=UPI002B209CEE|nr:UDP-2,4-diacetamido-2,4,6-trideoxy-beta-L-altropyranose hydrolase [Solidesulfovibrio sp.]MEA5090915.1 UDP-2,4-diacetamido-2,4,6-trideoxy-beta-L-altropyranose hydrolase [Solidesulfovibrio sp.]